jgi:hypothetical protein
VERLDLYDVLLHQDAMYKCKHLNLSCIWYVQHCYDSFVICIKRNCSLTPIVKNVKSKTSLARTSVDRSLRQKNAC